MKLLEGAMHPAYSLTCMEEERDFREQYWKVKPGDVAIDVGASYGAYTLTALDQGADYVFAFEPEPSIAQDLRRNIEANGWEGKAHVFTEALWDKSDLVDMRDWAPHWPAQTITGFYTARALDDVGALMARLDWLKIDVEGAEVRVIRGGLEVINRTKPTIIVECHTFLDSSIPDQVRKLLPKYYWKEVPRDPGVMLLGSPWR